MSEDRAGIIYLGVNRVNQKAYVGQTTYDLGHRVYAHLVKGRHHGASHFQNAIQKYGLEHFDFAVLEKCASKPELNDAEKRWIQILGCLAPCGYNIGSGGEGSLWKKRSAAWNAAVRSESVRAEKSRVMTACRAGLTPEQRESWRLNAAAARKKVPTSPNMFGDLNHAKKPEVRARIKEGLRRSWQDPEVRKRRAVARAASLIRRQKEGRE